MPASSRPNHSRYARRPVMRRVSIPLLVVPVLLAAACAPRASGPAASALETAGGRVSNIEAQDGQGVTAARLNALQAARAAGSFGATGNAIVNDPSPGS